MEDQKLYLLSIYLKKWSYGDNKLTVNYSFSYGDKYQRKHKELRLGKTTKMLSDFIEQLYKDLDGHEKNGKLKNRPGLFNDGETRKKLNTFFQKVTKEFSQNKKSRGKSRMISARSVDFYYSDKDYGQLDDATKFFVHINRGLNKIDGDLWTNAITDLKQAQKYKPDDVLVNKYLALAHNKLGQHAKALPFLKSYVKSDENVESLNTLASAYISLQQFDEADEIYKQISDQFEDKSIALFGRAKIAYKQGKKYIDFLNEISKSNRTWLVDKLKKKWEYTLADEENQTNWNASIAARYLGFDRPYDLTRKAFNKEIPSYFNAEKGTVRFVKEEIDCWVKLHNTFNLTTENYKIFPGKLTAEEKGKKRKKKQSAEITS